MIPDPKVFGHNLRYKVNITSCLLICVWMALPSLRIRMGVPYLIVFLGVWLLTTELSWLKNISRDIFWVGIFFVTFIPYLLSGTLQYGIAGPKVILVNFPIFFVGILINQYYMYYKKDKNTLGLIALVTLLFFMVGAVQTYLGLKLYPMASRILATGTDFYVQERILYAQLGIGGFSYVYASCFVVLGAFFLILRRINIVYKLISLLAFVLLTLMIVRASYAIALLITFSGIVLGLVARNNRSLTVILILLLAAILVLPMNFIGELILELRYIISNNTVLYNKITDVAVDLIFNIRGGQATKRLELYALSLNSFLRHPLFGIYGSLGGSLNEIGWHSGWLDILGAYGLFSGIPLFLILLSNYKKHMTYFSQKGFSGFYLVIYFLFIIFGLINPVLYIYEVGFIIFCFVPSVPFLPHAFIDEKDPTNS